MRILIAYDEPRAGARADDLDVLAQADAVERALRELGHATVRAGVGLDLAAARATVEKTAPDLVFNLVESLGGAGRFLPFFPALLEELGRSYTGSSSQSLFESGSKTLARARLAAAGLPVASGWTREELEHEPTGFLPGPYIIKSIWEHASLGLDEHSIVSARSPRELAAEIARREPALGGSAFAEAFIDGREFNLSVLAGAGEPEVLPPAEIRFEGFEAARPRIVGWRAKWDEQSFEYTHTPRSFDFRPSDAGLLDQLGSLALRAWKLFSLRGWARVDFRVDGAGLPWILEVNANPCLAPDAGFAAALERGGVPFARAIERILTDVVPAKPRPPAETEAPAAALPVADASAFAEGFSLRDTVRASDALAVRDILKSSGFFYDFEITIAVELVEERLTKGLASGYHFLFLDGPDGPAAYACFGPIACTTGSFDLFWIAVHERHRGQGLGRRLLEATERVMFSLGAHAIWIETSARALYEPTRAFYHATGYEQAALLPDYYAKGDGKIVFVKRT